MPRLDNGFAVLAEPITLEQLDIEQGAFAIPLINPEETKRISENIRELLGLLAKLGAKIPKPVLALILASGWLAPIIVDAYFDAGEGSILKKIISTANIGELLNSVLAGAGLFSIYNGAQLYKQSEQAEELKCSRLTVNATVPRDYQITRQNNLLLNAKVLVLKDELTRKDRLIFSLTSNNSNDLDFGPFASASAVSTISAATLDGSDISGRIDRHEESVAIPSLPTVPVSLSKVVRFSAKPRGPATAEPSEQQDVAIRP